MNPTTTTEARAVADVAAKPVRVQLRRTRGWRMPANTVSVARPTRHGNPFSIGDYGIPDAQAAVERFRQWRDDRIVGPVPPPVADLRGKNLACWCPIINSHGEYSPCHADVLISLANDIPMDEVICENTRRAKGEAL